MTHRRHSAVATVAALTALGGLWAVPAGAGAAHLRAHMAVTCAARATVLSTPRGLAVGFLKRGTPVFVITATTNHYWTDMRSTHSTFGWIAGWIHTRDLC
jgi:hypothetical protein